jgi:hypothetical protein
VEQVAASGEPPVGGGVGVHYNRYDSAGTAICLNGRLLSLGAQGHMTHPSYGPTGVSPRLTLACTEVAQFLGRGVVPAKGADGLSPGGLDFESTATAYEAPPGTIFTPGRCGSNIYWEAVGDEIQLHSKWSARLKK